MSKVYNDKKHNMQIRGATMRYLLKHGVVTSGEVRSKGDLMDPFTQGLLRKIIFDKKLYLIKNYI